MCGIAGAVDVDDQRAATRVRAINELQRHRGPDHTALVQGGRFTLGNTRLAILDPTPRGNQPFISRDGRYVCVFNGEIYNHRELISEFGLRMPTGCDGAVIPELWSRLGVGCLRLMRGMYAIAVVDTVEDRLTLCRDPFGIKPLYYRSLDDGTVVFASEVRALARVRPAPAVEAEAVASYLHLGSVPADRSPFVGIHAVPPNSTVDVSAGRLGDPVPIHGGDHPLTAPSPGVQAEDLGPTFRRSVELHLRSDVPTALLLSAGVDSTAIAAAARRLGQTLHCLTVTGTGPDDEGQEAAATAMLYEHEHELVPARLEPTDVEAFFCAMARPTVDGLNTFLVCRAVNRQGFRVALSGLGGDEALGGYPHYRVLPWLGSLNAMRRLPAPVLAAASRLVRGSRRGPKLTQLFDRGRPLTASTVDLLQRQIFSPAAVRALSGLDAPPIPGDRGSRTFEAMVEAEVRHYLQPTLLADADAFSMCSSVELRLPFVDLPFFAAAVTPASRGLRAPGKRRLAEALDDDRLRALARARKRGYTVPVKQWLQSGVLKGTLDSLDDPSAPVWRFLDAGVAGSILRVPHDGRWVERWAIAALNRWIESVSADAPV